MSIKLFGFDEESIKIGYEKETMNTNKMKWINPRESLPNEGQLIWSLRINNRAGRKNGLPAAFASIAKVERDEYNVLILKQISEKGMGGPNLYFNEWDHTMPDREESFFQDRLVTAWMPYVECLPEWDYLNIKESKSMITNSKKYKEAVERIATQKTLDQCTNNNTKFLYLKHHKPTKNGLYVVATRNFNVVVARYDENTCNPWILPNGEVVFSWYPLPESV